MSYQSFRHVILRRAVFGIESLKELDISASNIAQLPSDILQYMTSVEKVKAARNELMEMNFTNIPSTLTELDFSRNLITGVKLSFGNGSSLRSFCLQENRINSLDFITSDLEQLEYLDASNNQLTNIPKGVMLHIERLYEYNKHFDLLVSENPWHCDCSSRDFVKWVKTTKINIFDRDHLSCIYKGRSVYIVDINDTTFSIECENIVLLSALAGGVLLVVAGVAVVYRFRWTLRWKYYSRKYRRNELRNTSEPSRLRSAYILYATEDDETLHWVKHQLVRTIEVDWGMGPVFFPGRDDIGGVPMMENITAGLLSSRTAIWVINPAFCLDTNCHIGATFAFHRFHEFRRSRNMIVLLDNNFENYRGIDRIKRFIDPRLGITKITHSTEGHHENVFWTRLKTFVCDGYTNEAIYLDTAM